MAFHVNAFIIFANVGEIFRRAVWAIIRVENAHIGKEDEFKSYEYVPAFYENHTLIQDQQKKKTKPLSMYIEVTAMFLLLVVAAVFIVFTMYFNVPIEERRLTLGVLAGCCLVVVCIVRQKIDHEIPTY